jgi:competence protein ComEC
MSAPAIESDLSPPSQPFLYLTAALIAGILLDRWIQANATIAIALLLIAIALSAWFVLVRTDAPATWSLLVGFVAAGSLLSLSERTGVEPSRLRRLYEMGRFGPDDPVELVGTLPRPPEPAPCAFYLDLDAESIRIRGEELAATGRALLMVRLADASSVESFHALGLDAGSRLMVLVRLRQWRSYKTPGSPDFNEFLELKGYDLKGVVKSPLLIEKLEGGRINPLLAHLYRLRLRAMSAIDSSFKPRVAGTLKAMLLGNRYFLDSKVAEKLREGGIFHVLVISGMHVGIIAWALVGWQPEVKRRRPLRALAALLALWAYAAMVGMSPPVARAALMLSAGLIGPVLFRRPISLNGLAMASFSMLALKPALVADPGFQLSFMAVAAIVALALPLIERLRQIGQWRPSAQTPHPPRCGPWLKVLAEALFWDQRAADREMERSPIKYRLDKSPAAKLLSYSRLQQVIKNAVALLITSVCIQVTMLPLMAIYFNRAVLIGILLNVTAGLLTAAIILGSAAALTMVPISGLLASKLSAAVSLAHDLLVNSVEPFSHIRYATFRIAHFEGLGASIYALHFIPVAMLAVLIDRWRPVDNILPAQVLTRRAAPSAKHLALAAVALLASSTIVMRPFSQPPRGRLLVHFLDVGQGDSALVIFPGGTTMLVDGGGDPILNCEPGDSDQEESLDVDFSDDSRGVGEVAVSRFLWSLGLTRIDYVLATHSDRDHTGGLLRAIENFDVGQLIFGPIPASDPGFEALRKAAQSRRIPIGSVSAGDRFQIEGVWVEILWPPRPAHPKQTTGNNDSVVLRLQHGSVAMMLTGDIEFEAERGLIESRADLRADVLKVPHHGSRNSSWPQFIDLVKPRLAVVSAGERSPFGHPHKETIERYLSCGAQILQTGRHGTVTVESDGLGIKVRTHTSK